MPRRRSDGHPRSAGDGRVKAVSRASGSAKALALTRAKPADTLKAIKSPLTRKTVASPLPTLMAPRFRASKRQTSRTLSALVELHFPVQSPVPCRRPGS